MTRMEYQNIREMIETRFRQDMAALERVWSTVNGSNPPDSPVALVKEKPQETETIESDALGQPSPRRKYTITPEALAKKKAYMKAYWKKRRTQKSA